MKGEGIAGLDDFIKLQEIINKQHRRLFAGHLKLSLEELLIVLRNERHLLLSLPEATDATNLYPEGFSAGRLAALVEGDELWSSL